MPEVGLFLLEVVLFYFYMKSLTILPRVLAPLLLPRFVLFLVVSSESWDLQHRMKRSQPLRFVLLPAELLYQAASCQHQ